MMSLLTRASMTAGILNLALALAEPIRRIVTARPAGLAAASG